MDYLPLYVDLRDKGCLVVGAGAVALRKIELLLKAGARVRVVAPECIETIQGLADAGNIDLATRPYQTGDQAGHALVIAATGNASVDGQVFRDCRTDGILVNTVDSPDFSSAIFPSIVDRDPVVVAVSTGGRSPTLARVVRGWLEARLPPALGRLADFAAARRAIVKRTIESVSGRRKFWERVVGGATGELVLSDDVDRAGQQFTRELQESGPPAGFVALVGAGPGDPELITVRGLRLLQQADVVLYDNLVNERILDYARREAERIYVGKRRQFAGVRQEAINEMLLEHATAGRCVVRLKGGDPFIFGRGGEEIETLASHGIDCVVVPGITAALGAGELRGHTAHAPRPGPLGAIRHRPPGTRRGEPELAGTDRPDPDPGHLYGPARTRRDLRQACRQRPAAGHAGADDRARHAARPQGNCRPGGGIARCGRRQRCSRPDRSDCRRSRKAPAPGSGRLARLIGFGRRSEPRKRHSGNSRIGAVKKPLPMWPHEAILHPWSRSASESSRIG